MGALAITNGYPIAGLLIAVILIAVGCFFWFKIRSDYHRREEKWMKIFNWTFLINKYFDVFGLPEELYWKGIFGSIGLALILFGIYIFYTYILAYLDVELTFLLAFIPFLGIILTMIVCGVVFFIRHTKSKR